MLNPLTRKNINTSSLQSQRSSKVVDKQQSDNEIFCVLCKIKYTIEGYKQHIHQHKRKSKAKMSQIYNGQQIKQSQFKLGAKQVQASMIVENKDFRQSISKEQKSPSNIKNSAEMFGPSQKNRNYNLSNSIYSSKSSPYQSLVRNNPQFLEQKSSFIYNLDSSSLIQVSPRTISPFSSKKSPFEIQPKMLDFGKYQLEKSQAEQQLKSQKKHKARPFNIFAQDYEKESKSQFQNIEEI